MPWMIDGRAVYSPLFAGTYWEVQDVPLSDIERIEVVRGPGHARVWIAASTWARTLMRSGVEALVPARTP